MSEEDIRSRVSEHYAQLVSTPGDHKASGLCGSTASLAGYAEGELHEASPCTCLLSIELVHAPSQRFLSSHLQEAKCLACAPPTTQKGPPS